jgi:hypothetical protein
MRTSSGVIGGMDTETADQLDNDHLPWWFKPAPIHQGRLRTLIHEGIALAAGERGFGYFADEFRRLERQEDGAYSYLTFMDRRLSWGMSAEALADYGFPEGCPEWLFWAQQEEVLKDEVLLDLLDTAHAFYPVVDDEITAEEREDYWPDFVAVLRALFGYSHDCGCSKCFGARLFSQEYDRRPTYAEMAAYDAQFDE